MQSKEQFPMSNRNLSSQIFVGLILILVGLTILVANLGWADLSGIFQWIPSFFILLGVWQLIANKFRFITGPIILIAGGAAFQLAAFDIIEFESIWQFWPLILILIGASMLLERFGVQVPGPFNHGADEAEVSILSIFNGPEHLLNSTSFRGGETTAIFGGIDLDLRNASITTPPARINAFAMFGGIDILVPETWIVKTEVLGIFGGSDDDRPEKPAGTPDLIVTGFAMFGGVTIKSK